jgi:hypothetical protein
MHLHQIDAHDDNKLDLSQHPPPQAHDAKMSISITTLHFASMFKEIMHHDGYYYYYYYYYYYF